MLISTINSHVLDLYKLAMDSTPCEFSSLALEVLANSLSASSILWVQHNRQSQLSSILGKYDKDSVAYHPIFRRTIRERNYLQKNQYSEIVFEYLKEFRNDEVHLLKSELMIEQLLNAHRLCLFLHSSIGQGTKIIHRAILDERANIIKSQRGFAKLYTQLALKPLLNLKNKHRLDMAIPSMKGCFLLLELQQTHWLAEIVLDCSQCLSKREQQIADLLQQKCSNKEISDHFAISLSTTKNHVYSLFQKLGIESRAQFIDIHSRRTSEVY